MKRKGLRAKSWGQRSCAVVEAAGLGDPDGDNVQLLDYCVIYTLLIISLSEVKEIMKKIRVQFQNGNEGKATRVHLAERRGQAL
jgi:hypothetical protein